MMDDGQHVDGTWTGHLKAVRVSEAHGRSFDATAFEIDTGPKEIPPSPALHPRPPSGELVHMPLLSRSWDKPHLILDPKGLPIGSRVRVRGRLQKRFLDADGPGVSDYPINRGEVYGEVEAEPVILLRGDVELLKE